MLGQLPLEINFEILSYLSAKDLVNIGSVNKEYNEIYQNNILWKPLYQQDLNILDPISESYGCYKSQFKFIRYLINYYNLCDLDYINIKVDIMIKDICKLLQDYLVSSPNLQHLTSDVFRIISGLKYSRYKQIQYDLIHYEEEFYKALKRFLKDLVVYHGKILE